MMSSVFDIFGEKITQIKTPSSHTQFATPLTLRFDYISVAQMHTLKMRDKRRTL